MIRYKDNTILVDSNSVDLKESPNHQWLMHCLLPKFIKWWKSFLAETCSGDTTEVTKIESLSLINIEEYNQLYNDLKDKYGIDMVKVSFN